MQRIPFSQVLKNASIDLRREYDRLYSLFCVQKHQDEFGNTKTLKDCCAASFINLHFRGTCVSLDDFDDFYGYHFEKVPSDFDIDYLVSFCEYSYNLAIYNQGGEYGMTMAGAFCSPMQFYVQQVMRVIESIGYMENAQNGVFDFVPKDQAAISVAEIVDTGLSYKVIEYNHHSMKGNLEKKKEVLLALSEKLESERKRLKQIDSSLETDLFYLLNNMNIRHNNIDSGKKQNPAVVSMSKDELEHWYDDTYQMCLLAFMELDHIERKERIKKIKPDNQN